MTACLDLDDSQSWETQKLKTNLSFDAKSISQIKQKTWDDRDAPSREENHLLTRHSGQTNLKNFFSPWRKTVRGVQLL